MMPLTMAPSGQKHIIRKITGQDATRRHLAQLGFVVGEYVSIVTSVDGNVIIDVKGTRVALGKSMANRIMV